MVVDCCILDGLLRYNIQLVLWNQSWAVQQLLQSLLSSESRKASLTLCLSFWDRPHMEDFSESNGIYQQFQNEAVCDLRSSPYVLGNSAERCKQHQKTELS